MAYRKNGTRNQTNGTHLVLVGLSLLMFPVAVDADLGVTISPPAHLNSDASSDSTNDGHCRLATDGQGHWIAVWTGSDPTGPFGSDFDIFVSQSVNDGVTWTVPGVINTDAQTDSRTDSDPVIATDGQGNWIVAWVGSGSPGSGNDEEIYESHSSDDGNSWSAPSFINDQATGDFWPDQEPFIATDRNGMWIVVWKGFPFQAPQPPSCSFRARPTTD